MNTIYLIIVLFAVGAIVGTYLLSLILRKKGTPKFASFIHGAFVATALGLLIYYSFQNSPGPIESIVLFIIAALGGLILVFRDITGKSLPSWLAIGHGLVAIAGFIFLLVYTFT